MPDAAGLRSVGLDPARVLTVTCTVRDDYTDQPVVGADVVLGERRYTTDAEGRCLPKSHQRVLHLRVIGKVVPTKPGK